MAQTICNVCKKKKETRMFNASDKRGRPQRVQWCKECLAAFISLWMMAPGAEHPGLYWIEDAP